MWKGFVKYLREQMIVGLSVSEFSGNHQINNAKLVIKDQIIKGHPIPYLLLHHKILILDILPGIGF